MEDKQIREVLDKIFRKDYHAVWEGESKYLIFYGKEEWVDDEVTYLNTETYVTYETNFVTGEITWSSEISNEFTSEVLEALNNWFK